MKRRTFIKRCFGILALSCLPQTKPKPKVEACFKPVSSYIGNAPTEFGQQIGWKMSMAYKIQNDGYICLLRATA